MHLIPLISNKITMRTGYVEFNVFSMGKANFKGNEMLKV